MKDKLDPLAVARQPTQLRARQRFNCILGEAETLLKESGLTGFSIPVLAERLGYTRGSVYVYFPTNYAILNELVIRDLAELEAVFVSRTEKLSQMHWSEAVDDVVNQAYAFYNSRPVARLLILGGAVSDMSYRAQEMTIKHLGDLGRRIWERKGARLPRNPDVATLAAEIATACFRRSFFDHGKITPIYRDTAANAMRDFLKPYMIKAKPRSR